MISHEVAGELGPSRKESIANGFAGGKFGGEASSGMKEGC